MIVDILGKNKCIIHDELNNLHYLQSYREIVAAYNENEDKYYLYLDWDLTTTTATHVGKFIGIPCKEVRKRIKSGEITVINKQNGN